MKPFLKRLSKTVWAQELLCWVIACYIRFVHCTCQRKLEIDKASEPYMHGDLPAIFSFWHGRLMMMPMLCPPKRKMHVLISTHRDGEIIARAMHRFHFATIRGSSTRGGGEAAVKTVKTLQAGDNVSITPDGPKGPAMKVQPGIITISELAKIPVIAVTFSASRYKRAKSWDSFMLALPFSRIYYKISEPLFNPTKEALEKLMVSMVEHVDAHV